MKLFLLLLSVNAIACGERRINDQAVGKFVTHAEQEAESGESYFYARYRFTHDEYEDVEVAVQVALRNGHPATLRVKDLSSAAEDNPIEQAQLSSRGCSLSFRGVSSGTEGGAYTGELEQSGGLVNGCCGDMTFVPAVDTTLTFAGIKLATLSASDWEQLTGEEVAANTETPEGSGDNTGAGDNAEPDGGIEPDDAVQIFYALDNSTILLSKSSLLPPRAGQMRRYLMQAIVGTDSDGAHKAPVVHIKQVNDNGTIAAECLSLLFDEQDNTAGDKRAGRFKFNFAVNGATVDSIWGFSDMYSDDPYSSNTFFTVGISLSNELSTRRSYSALRAGAGTNDTVPLVSPQQLTTKGKEWGIVDDIAAAFGTGSGCEARGHNRICVGCIMQ